MRHDACRVMKAVFVALLLFARDGISACDRSSCPCREAGREEESSGCGQAKTSIPGRQGTQDRGNETA